MNCLSQDKGFLIPESVARLIAGINNYRAAASNGAMKIVQ